MAARSVSLQSNHSAANYVNKKGINELFEAIMTALMIHKPDDHIAFIRECLDKAQNSPTRVRWDFFVSNSANPKTTTAASRSSGNRNRSRPLPPVRPSNYATKTNQLTALKPPALPPIDNKTSANTPIIFILSSKSSTKLCSRLMERYNRVTYLSINDAANIDEDSPIDWKRIDHRYACVQRTMDQSRSQTRGFLIAGNLEEKNFMRKWQDKLGPIDLIIILSSTKQIVPSRNLRVIQIDSASDFDDIHASAIQALDQILVQDTSSLPERSQSLENTSHRSTLPIIFCIDNRRSPIRQNRGSGSHKLAGHPSIDEEFDTADDDPDDDSNNSFIYTLCERLADQFSFKHIHYADSKKVLLHFDQLKISVIESMSSCAGYIIDCFPNSLDELHKFQAEIGPGSALIYIGDHLTDVQDEELHAIVDRFRKENRTLFVDCRMEVDEIYEDLKKDIVKFI